MGTFSVEFLGCKISHTDAEEIRDALVAAGHEESDAADISVINTCCITGEAEKKSRKKVRQRLGEPTTQKVFVTGCGANLNPAAYTGLGEEVTVLSGGAGAALPTILRIADQLSGLACKGEGKDPHEVGDRSQPNVSHITQPSRTRAFVKVQDGCNFHCSYCVVPIVRGDTRSRVFDAVLSDVAKRVARGQREIVLTGINIGLYRDDESRSGLPALMLAVADVPGVARVRLSSIESNHVNRRLVEAIASHPKICPHLHVPMQSGDDGVLRDMGRHYNADGYARSISVAREFLPHLNLTTDIIVGYPTEGDAAFVNTLQLATDLNITKVHAFPYSPRPGTQTQDSNPVSPEVKKRRSAQLREAADLRAKALWASKVGTTDSVMIERRATEDGILLSADEAASTSSLPLVAFRGYTRDYCPVVVTGQHNDGELVDVRITGISAVGLIAEPVSLA